MISQIILNKLSDISIRLKDVAGVFMAAAKNVDSNALREKLLSRAQQMLVFAMVADQTLSESGQDRQYFMSPDAEAECFFIEEEISKYDDGDVQSLNECLKLEEMIVGLYDQINQFALPEEICPFIKTQKTSIEVNHKTLENFKKQIQSIKN